jgi:predicted component of type VI protein secretion system
MLTLIVTSLEGRLLDPPLRADFGAEGGSIGRRGDNTLVLPDLEGRVWPLQATIHLAPAGYAVRNCSPSPMYVNGAPIASEADALLAPGDEIRIGAYSIQVGPVGQAQEAASPAGSEYSVSGVAQGDPRSPSGSGPESPVHLQRALLEGLGLPNLVLPGGITPEFMERLGRLLRQMTEGTMDLLRIRAETKSSVHAGMTVIDAQAINPFKAAWDAEVALQQLLAPQRADILPPLAAIADAYHDLHVHDRGLVAGIHAALAGLLERFKPSELEKRLSAERRIEHLLPGAGKARRWDLLVELYGELAVDAQRDFWTVFEREFLDAYARGRRLPTAGPGDQTHRPQAGQEPDPERG